MRHQVCDHQERCDHARVDLPTRPPPKRGADNDHERAEDMAPTYSVIIPTYGRPQFLAEAIDSVLAQTVDDFEIIVVDDASPEPVAVPMHPKIRVVRAERNGGCGAARNFGVSLSRGKVLTFLDDDDLWMPERLSLAATGLERAPIAICWQGDGSGRILEGDVYDVIHDAITPSPGATALLRDAWIPFSESYRGGQDLFWWLDITRRFRVATVPQQGLRVRRHGGGREGYGLEQRIANSLRLMEERAEYFTGHSRASAFRWKRIGLMQLLLGRRREARRSFLRALSIRPNARDLWHLLRSVRFNRSAESTYRE